MNGSSIKYSLLFLLSFHFSFSQEKEKDSLQKFELGYGSKGFELRTPNDHFLLQIQSRLQFRYATPEDQDPINFNDYNEDNTHVFKINRARLKVGGHAYQPWLNYYWEYDLAGSNLLDFRLMIEKWEWLSFKIGQWKIEYSRERRISSGEQQMVDRSIINRPFTIDRQQGIEIYGHLEETDLLNFNYWASVNTGTGRGSLENDDRHLMYFGRLQWNFLGEELGFEASDLEIHKNPVGILAISGVTNRSKYTRFSTNGGGALSRFEEGEDGQYRVNQVNFETALMYKGFSWQSEYHHKDIIDKLNNDRKTQLAGYYFQAGYFLHQGISWWPQPLELAVRYSGYKPSRELDILEEEKSLNLNWFFKGHKNKLSMEISNFDTELLDERVTEIWRFRVQWDVSF